MKLEKYKKNPELKEKVVNWININLKNYLKTNPENETEIEHIIDFLNSNKAPKRIKFMSYDEAKAGAEKWTKTLIKKAHNIVETEEDTKVVKDFKDGYKLVQLVGKNAFKREGKLMRHCVSSYHDKQGVLIYSLRDNKNEPHCTIEVTTQGDEIRQIKGKGNGSIHPKYINYVVKSLKKIGRKLSTNDMQHLGYVDLEDYEWQLLEKHCKNIQYMNFMGKRFLYKYSKLEKK